jgi:hypothetical protein
LKALLDKGLTLSCCFPYQEEHFSAVVNMGRSTIDMDDDSQKVLAQALQEKVTKNTLCS